VLRKWLGPDIFAGMSGDEVMEKHVYRALLMVCCCALPAIAHAYVGPGAGLSAIGSILAFLGALVLLILGFFWYPIKRFIKGKRENKSQISKHETSAINSGSESHHEENNLDKK